LQDYVNLEIIKKRGSSINPDIHHSKVFSSERIEGIRSTWRYCSRELERIWDLYQLGGID